jgi:CDP-diacylglycerol--serine O-phosphatidyltransferase
MGRVHGDPDVSSIATFGWASMRLRRRIRFEALVVIVAIGAALISAPWPTLVVVSALYLATIPFSATAYARNQRLRRTPPVPPVFAEDVR